MLPKGNVKMARKDKFSPEMLERIEKINQRKLDRRKRKKKQRKS